MNIDNTVTDPYANCERTCYHDLARGMLVTDLKHDGPYTDFADAWYRGEALSPVARTVRDWQARV